MCWAANGDVEVVNAGANSATLPAGTYINRVVRLPDGVAPACAATDDIGPGDLLAQHGKRSPRQKQTVVVSQAVRDVR